jgi:hypothetical protein
MTSDTDNMLIVDTFSGHSADELVKLLLFIYEYGKTIEALDAVLAEYSRTHDIEKAILSAKNELDL